MKPAPTDAAPPPKRKRWRKRLVLAVLATVVVGCVWPGIWLPTAIESLGPWAAKSFAGLTLSIESVETAHWSKFEVRGLDLRADGEDPWIDVRVQRVVAEFRVDELLAQPLRAIERVELTRPRVFLSLDFGGSTSSSSGSVSLPSWPDALPTLLVRNGEFRMTGVAPESITVTGLEVQTSDGERLDVAFRTLELGGWIEEDDFETGTISANYASGAWTEVTAKANGAELVTASRADLSGWATGRYAFDANVAFIGAVASATAELTGDRMSGTLDVQTFPLAWFESLMASDSGLVGFASLQGSFEFPTADPVSGSGQADLNVTDFSLNSALPANLAGTVTWDDGYLRAEQLRIEQSTNALQLQDFAWRLDSVELSSFAFALAAEARDVPALVGFAGNRVPTDPVPEHELQLIARVADGRLLIERGYLDTAGGRLSIREGVITETPTTKDPRRVSLTAEFEELSELGRLFSAGRWNGSLGGEVIYSDVGNGPQLRCTLAGEHVTVEDHELGNMRFEGIVSPPLLIISELVSDGSAGLVQGVGVFDWESSSLRDVDLELDLRDLSRLAPEIGLSGSASGAITLNGPLDQLDGSLSLQSDGLAFDGYSFSSGDIQAQFTNGDVRIESLSLADHAALIELSGDMIFDEGHALRVVSLDRFRVAVNESNLELVGPTRFSWDGETADIEDMQLDGSAGSLDLTLHWGPGAREVRLNAKQLQLDELLAGRALDDLKLDGLDGQLTFAIEDGVALGSSDLSARGVAWPGLGPPIDFRLRADQRDHVLTVAELSITGEQGELLRGTARVPLAPLAEEWLPDAPIALQLSSSQGLARQLGLALGHPHTAGELTLLIELGGTLSNPTGRIDAQLNELLWAAAPDRPALGPAQIDIGVLIRQNELVIERGTGTLDTAEAVDLRGTIRGPTDIRRWLADGAAASEASALNLSVTTADFDWQRVSVQLDRIGVPAGPVRTGVVTAELTVGGSLATPLLTGSATLAGGSARMGNLPSITEVGAELHFEGRELTLEEFTGELGGSPFKLSGTLGLNDEDIMIDARLVGDDLLVVRSGGTRVRANVDATVKGPLNELVIAGRAEIAEGIYSTPIDVTAFLGGPKPARARGIQLFRVSELPISDARFDLEIGTAPNSSFTISTATYKGGLRPDLHLGGTGALPILTGTVYFDPAIVSLPVTQLHVTSGTLVFDKANPFVPVLQVQAEGRMRGYDVFAQVSGPFDGTEVTLSSDPPLNGTELLNLVLTGRVPGDETTRAGDVAQQLATYLAKDFLAWWVTPEPSDKSSDSLMDRIEIISGEDVSKTGANTMEGRFRVADDVTRKDDAIYLVAQRDEYDFYNFGIRISFRVK